MRSDREKLIELLTAYYGADPAYYDVDAPSIADHLLANGVVVREKPQTNADRIRAMSDEELAETICGSISSDACDYCEHGYAYCDGTPCKGVPERVIVLEWLRQPVKDGEGDGNKI